MARHRCNACGIEFESAEVRPSCPSGCRYPHEHPTSRGDYITTEPVGAMPKPTQEPAPQQEKQEEAPPKASRGKGGQKKDQPEEQY